MEAVLRLTFHVLRLHLTPPPYPTPAEFHVDRIDKLGDGAIVIGFQISLRAFLEQRQLGQIALFDKL